MTIAEATPRARHRVRPELHDPLEGPAKDRPPRFGRHLRGRAKSKAERFTTYLDGEADLVLEIVGAESVFRDYNGKYYEYEEAGVREYWIVNPISDTVDLSARNAAWKFAARTGDSDGRYHSSVIDGLWLHPKDLFARERPDTLSLLKQIDPSVLT